MLRTTKLDDRAQLETWAVSTVNIQEYVATHFEGHCPYCDSELMGQ